MGISVPALFTARRRFSLDAFGASASLICAVHCGVVALALGTLPAISFLAAPWIEWAFLSVSLIIGLAALIPGYRRHGLRRPLVFFGVGVAILFALRTLHLASGAIELSGVAAAAGFLVSAHWINRGATHRCACGPRHHHH